MNHSIADPAIPLPRQQLQTFNFTGVTLDDSRLRHQFHQVTDYYLNIPSDDLLKGFRQRAGKAAPGKELGGWYSADGFSVFGQIISGLSRLYAAGGDQRCLEKANELISEWASCIEPDGYFFYSRKTNAPHYVYDKMVGGLLDAYLYCGNKEALKYLSRISDWAIKNLDTKKVYAYNNWTGNTEWYTLSENLYRAYIATGDAKYRDFAQQWEYTEFWDIFAGKGDILSGQTKAYHAYSHTNALSGAATAYLVKGQTHYLDTLKNAYDYILTTQTYATGGYGPDEHFLLPEELVKRLADSQRHFESQCGSWAVFKLAKYLICLTGDAGYGDWAELMIYNGIGATIPMNPQGGVQYWSNYSLDGATKKNYEQTWTCCTGTRPMAIADYHDLIYFKDAENIYVNLYTPSTVTWDRNGMKVKIQQLTKFPERNTTEFLISTETDIDFGINFRLASWLTGPISIKVNGKKVKPETKSSWATIQRKWHNGDRITVEMPISFRLKPMGPEKYPTALMYGPVLMAVSDTDGNPSKEMAFDDTEKALIPGDGESLTFHVKSNSSLAVKPFYSFNENEPYFVYFDPARVHELIPHDKVKYSPNWHNAGTHHYSNIVGATAQADFEGTAIKWSGAKYDDAGKAEVSIDGKIVTIIDQFGPGRKLPFEWKHEGLTAGKHTIKLTIIADKDAQSKGTYINVAGFAAK